MTEESILLMGIDGLSEKNEFALFEIAKNNFQKTNQILFLPEHEYELINKGIDKSHLHESVTIDSIKTLICQYTKTRYLLKIELLNSQKGSIYGSYTNLEVKNNPYRTINRETNKASMLFTLTDTKTHLTEYKFNVTTTISPLSINDENNGERNVNLSSQFGAISESFKKGIRKLRKEIITR